MGMVMVKCLNAAPSLVLGDPGDWERSGVSQDLKQPSSTTSKR